MSQVSSIYRQLYTRPAHNPSASVSLISPVSPRPSPYTPDSTLTALCRAGLAKIDQNLITPAQRSAALRGEPVSPTYAQIVATNRSVDRTPHLGGSGHTAADGKKRGPKVRLKDDQTADPPPAKTA